MALEVFGEQTRGVLATTMCITLYKGEGRHSRRQNQTEKRERREKEMMIGYDSWPANESSWDRVILLVQHGCISVFVWLQVVSCLSPDII